MQVHQGLHPGRMMQAFTAQTGRQTQQLHSLETPGSMQDVQ